MNWIGKAAVLMLIPISLAVGQQTPQSGFYVDQSGTLAALNPAAYSGTQSSNSIVKANIYWTFRGSHSPMQLATNHPRFRLVCGNGATVLLMLCVPGDSQPRDLVVVRLDEKSDRREARTVSASMFGGRGGFDPKKTVTVTPVKRDDGSWDVSPSQDLKPGEYLITTGTNPQGFDFGIQR